MPCDELGQPAEVLSDRCQRELQLGPIRPAQSQAAQPQDTLEMCKQHLNTFSVMARSLECFRLGQRASNVTRLLVDAARHPAERRIWAAMRLQWAATAVAHAGHIQEPSCGVVIWIALLIFRRESSKKSPAKARLRLGRRDCRPTHANLRAKWMSDFDVDQR